MHMNRLFKKKPVLFLSHEQADRQGRAARLACEAFPQEGGAMSFLNAFDDQLGGRPIDLAVASAEGLRAVEYAIAARSAPSIS
jgi:hypothetical protein